MNHHRSLLFVPGNRPDRFEKACASGADLVCIDLEDAVGPDEKDAARGFVMDFLEGGTRPNVSLRINSLDTPFAKDDIAALSHCGLTLPFVMVPKVDGAQSVSKLAKAMPEALGPICAIIESAKGLINAAEIFAHPRVTMALYGAIDYAGDVGCNAAWETHLYARSHLVAAATALDVLLFDVPYIDVRDVTGCEAATRRAKGLGIYARSAIHPAQIGAIHAALAPSEAEVTEAQRIIEAYAAAGGNVALLDGKFIEAPVVKSAQRVLAFKPAS